jgi:hypothetical protein
VLEVEEIFETKVPFIVEILSSIGLAGHQFQYSGWAEEGMRNQWTMFNPKILTWIVFLNPIQERLSS